MNPETAHHDFFCGRRSESLPIVVGDAVEVFHGKKKGTLASAISLESVGDDPRFRVEFGDGSAEELPLSDLKLANPNRKCIYAKNTSRDGEDYFVGIYREQGAVILVTSERHGGDTSVPLSEPEIEGIVKALNGRSKE
jgi:hypothetical protein